jgi:hypothetical protein
VKEKISYLILEHIKFEGKPVEKVKFIDVFEKKA